MRYIGNFSTGQLGAALAERYVALGHSVVLLAPQSVAGWCPNLFDPFWEENPFQFRTFESSDDLRRELLSLSSARLVLHAAAVADYAPVKVEGKISSDQDELTVQLRRTPKILSELRDHFGDTTTIVGFKLLSGVPEDELIKVASAQIMKNDTNYCVANDLQERNTEFRYSKRKLHVVHPDGSYESTVGSTDEVATFISQKIGVRKRPKYSPESI